MNTTSHTTVSPGNEAIVYRLEGEEEGRAGQSEIVFIL